MDIVAVDGDEIETMSDNHLCFGGPNIVGFELFSLEGFGFRLKSYITNFILYSRKTG